MATIFPASLQAYNTNQAADIVVGQPNMTSNAVNSGGLNASSLNYPNGVYSDGKRLFVADYGNNRVLVYNTLPVKISTAADIVIGQLDMTSNAANQNGGVNANTLYCPGSVFSDGTRLFVSDSFNNRVLIYNTVSAISDGASANIVIGQPSMTSNIHYTNANFLFYPKGAYSDGIRLFVADMSNNRVLIYNSIPTSNNAAADIVIGQPDMTSSTANNGGLNANSLHGSASVYSDGTRLLVADYFNNRVLIYNTIPTANNVAADVVIGQPNMTSNTNNNGGLNANTLFGPSSIYSDGVRLYVADISNWRLLIYNTIPTTNNASADIVIGQLNMTSNSSGVTANVLNPYSVYSDRSRLFVSDNFNNRILTYYATQLVSVSPSYGMSGKTVQITVAGAGHNTTFSPNLILTRNGFSNIANTSVNQNNVFNYTYTLDLTQATPECYDVTINAYFDPRSLKQAFTVLSPLQAPLAWKVNDLGVTLTAGNISSNFCGLAIGDADQDNTQELYVANQDSKLWQVKLDHGWSNYAIPGATGVSGASFGGLLLVDGNGDGAWEVYGASADNHVWEFKTSAWQASDLGAISSGGFCGMASLDADHDGVPEIYVSKPNGHIFQIIRNSGIVKDIYNATFPPNPSHANALASGDGNNDNTMKIYSANTDYKLYQYVFDGVSWQATALGMATNAMYSVAVGDGDNDGKNEVYGASQDGYVYQARYGTSWGMHSIGARGNGAMYSVVISDGENNGSNQVYAACGDGHVYKYKCQSGNWTTSDLGNANTPLYALAVGDADNDNYFEVYALGQNNHIYQFKASSVATATPTPQITGTIPTATVTTTPTMTTPQNYFKIYHSQINPLRGEQARIRWTQPQTGPVSITIYNLLGDKVVTLQENMNFTSGEYHEVVWNGRTQKGTVAGSGIYIVLFAAPGIETRGKIAVIK